MCGFGSTIQPDPPVPPPVPPEPIVHNGIKVWSNVKTYEYSYDQISAYGSTMHFLPDIEYFNRKPKTKDITIEKPYSESFQSEIQQTILDFNISGFIGVKIDDMCISALGKRCFRGSTSNKYDAGGGTE